MTNQNTPALDAVAAQPAPAPHSQEAGTMDETMFPILHNYRLLETVQTVRKGGAVALVVQIPWGMIAPHERQAHDNHGQTLARLAERGGLSACEACAVLDNRKWQKMHDAAAHARLMHLIDEYRRAALGKREGA